MFAVRLIFWLGAGVLLNGYFPFQTDVSIGEVTYGPSDWDEVASRGFSWLLIVLAGEMILWVKRNFSIRKVNKT